MTSFESKIKDLEQEKRDILERFSLQLDEVNNRAKMEIEQLQSSSMKYKQELIQLEEFKSKKVEAIYGYKSFVFII